MLAFLSNGDKFFVFFFHLKVDFKLLLENDISRNMCFDLWVSSSNICYDLLFIYF